MKRLSALVALLALLTILSGCGDGNTPPVQSAVAPAPTAAAALLSEDPAALFTEVQNVIAKTPCTSAHISTSMVLNIFYGESEAIAMTCTTDTEVSVSPDPLSSHSEITSKSVVGSAGASAMTETALTETYMVRDGDSLVSYTCSDGIWLKDEEAVEPDAVLYCASGLYAADSLHFDLSYVDYEGKASYCLEASMSGSEIRPILVDLFPDMGYDAADLSQATGDMTLLIEKDTLRPIYQAVSFYNMGEPIEKAYSQIGIDVALQRCFVKQSFLSYESAPEIKLPSGAAEKAEAWGRLANGNPVNGDGTYTIREGAVVADITPPKGFTVDSVAYNSITLSSKKDITLRYTIFCLESGDALTEEINSTVEAYSAAGFTVYRTDGTYASHHLNYTTCMLKMPTDGTVSEQYYAWAPLISDDDYIYYILVEFVNGYDSAGQPTAVKSELSEASVNRALDAASLGKLMQ